MDVVAYIIVFLTLTKRLKAAYPDIIQPWYAKNHGALGTIDNLELYFILLKCNSRTWGHYPEPTKITIIVHLDNIEAGKLFGVHHGSTVFAGTHYIGG